MAGKRTLNAKNLQTLGAAALAELLIEVSAGNALIQRRLRLALAAAGGAEGAATETGAEGRSGDAATAPANRTGVRMAIPNAGTRVARLTLRLPMGQPPFTRRYRCVNPVC
jgi:hypothetical protein